MQNDHRLSLITFVENHFNQCRQMPPQPTHTLHALTRVLQYFSSVEGQFWLFYWSDVQLAQDVGVFEYIIPGEDTYLQAEHVRSFMVTDFQRWNRRMASPGVFLQDEITYLVERSPDVHPQVMWPTLMWCASPQAHDWRFKSNNTYAYAYASGSVVEYQGELIDGDDVEAVCVWEATCDMCKEDLPCVGESLCDHCSEKLDGHQGDDCAASNGCDHISCRYHSAREQPVLMLGRLYAK